VKPCDNQEDAERHDQEVDDGVEEHAVVERGRTGSLCVAQFVVVNGAEIEKQLREIHVAEQKADRRHDYVIDR